MDRCKDEWNLRTMPSFSSVTAPSIELMRAMCAMHGSERAIGNTLGAAGRGAAAQAKSSSSNSNSPINNMHQITKRSNNQEPIFIF